jgi:hypothetical protein
MPTTWKKSSQHVLISKSSKQLYATNRVILDAKELTASSEMIVRVSYCKYSTSKFVASLVILMISSWTCGPNSSCSKASPGTSSFKTEACSWEAYHKLLLLSSLLYGNRSRPGGKKSAIILNSSPLELHKVSRDTIDTSVELQLCHSDGGPAKHTFSYTHPLERLNNC